jgi:hypothetical protein
VVGIALLTAPLGAYDGYSGSGSHPALGYMQAGSYAYYDGNYNFNVAAHANSVFTISYSASGGTLTYQLDSTVLGTQSVTPAQVAGLTDVDFGFGGNNTPQTATLSGFELSVASVPEPASVGMLLVGGVAMLGRRRAKA